MSRLVKIWLSNGSSNPNLKLSFSRPTLERSYRSGAQAPVDFHDRLLRNVDLVHHQGFAQVRSDVEIVDEEDLELGDAALEQLFNLYLRHLFVALEDYLAGAFVHDVVGGYLGPQLVGVDRKRAHLGRFQLFDRGAGELAVFLDDDLAGLGLNVAGGALAGK